MLSIKNNVSNKLVINNSKFITFLFSLDDFSYVDIYLRDLKSKYNDATHICYAYIFENNIKACDDGEPSNTAGLPILNVLKTKNLDHILCCVVRYFGGIKLGANGLVRAYSNCCKDCVSMAQIINLVPGKIYDFCFDYNIIKLIDYKLKDCIILDKKYDECVFYRFKVRDCDNLLIDSYGKLRFVANCYFEDDIKEKSDFN